MNTRGNPILVIGATGQQGGAVVKALQKTDFAIRAFVRPHVPTDKQAKQIQHWEQQGLQIVQGDLDDAYSVRQAMQGVYGVFSVTTFQDRGVQIEEERGKRVADAAKQAGVQHFVYSSVGGADRKSGVPHFESKWRV